MIDWLIVFVYALQAFKDRRQYQTLGNCNLVWAVTHVLETELTCSIRSASALSLWLTSSAIVRTSNQRFNAQYENTYCFYFLELHHLCGLHYSAVHLGIYISNFLLLWEWRREDGPMCFSFWYWHTNRRVKV